MKWKVWGYKDDTPLLIIEADSSDEAIKKAREINHHYTITQRIKKKEKNNVNITERNY